MFTVLIGIILIIIAAFLLMVGWRVTTSRYEAIKKLHVFDGYFVLILCGFPMVLGVIFASVGFKLIFQQ